MKRLTVLLVLLAISALVAYAASRSTVAAEDNSCSGIVTQTFSTSQAVERGRAAPEERWWALVWSEGKLRTERISKELAIALVPPAYWRC